MTLRKYWLFLVVAALGVILVDQISKALVVANLAPNEEWAPIPGIAHLFAITYTTNTGAAFGIFPDAGKLFLVIRVIVVGLILYYYRKLSSQGGWLMRLALGLQLGGALGNLIDQVRQGYVVDFIHVKFWPVFNVADSSIVVGTLLLVIVMFLDERGKDPASRRELTEGDKQA